MKNVGDENNTTARSSSKLYSVAEQAEGGNNDEHAGSGYQSEQYPNDQQQPNQ